MLAEPDHESALHRMSDATVLGVGAPTVVEAAMVLSSRLRTDARPLLNEFLRETEAEVIPFGQEHLQIAIDAFQRYGKGRHEAALNFGDCLTYAVARLAGLPLLFTGDDFAKTDLEAYT
jgi:ribonuclease VapC